MAVVVKQPGSDFGDVQLTSQPMGIQLQPGLPPGLQYLAALDDVKIHQHLDLLEVLVGWEKNNKYQILNAQGQQFMYATENTDCCTRQMLGNIRPFEMNITDNNNQPLIQLHRPCRCFATFMWCCCLQEMDIHSPPGMSIGSVRQKWTCWTPRYEVLDGSGTVAFTIVGECCYCRCCDDVIFKILDGQGSTEIGQIIKHWTGCREVCGGVNDFSVRFPVNLDVMKKALLLSATFLIDYNYFEQNKN